ncbi:MAG: PqqD family protein [Clostridia bacterium]|nr:PqqD family protein [Clostridia bacterium]
MKIKDGFILREVAGSYIVVAVGSAVKTFNGVINLNQTGAFLWELLQKGAEKEDLVKALLEEYEVDEQTASKDVDVFIEKLEQANLIK